MFNQINFGNSSSFNNINLYCIPKVPQNENANYNRFLNLGLKNKIKANDKMQLEKIFNFILFIPRFVPLFQALRHATC